MGVLHYGGNKFSVDDRLLAHLQIVIGSKLRRSENFFLAWDAERDSGTGRHSIWVDNGMPIHFEYYGGRIPSINRDWVELLARNASSPMGLYLGDPDVAEPGISRESVVPAIA